MYKVDNQLIKQYFPLEHVTSAMLDIYQVCESAILVVVALGSGTLLSIRIARNS